MSAPETRTYLAVQRSKEPQFERWSSPVVGSSDREYSVSAGYRRCLDFDPNDDPGQDFCGFMTDGRFVVAVVADGVSQSFMGNLAAESVGRALLDAVWAQRDRPMNASQIRAALEEARGPLHQRVSQYTLGPEVAAMVRGALEETRASAGSQTVFGALRFDLQRACGEVALLGDILVSIHSQGAATLMRAEPRGRFSDIDGLRGEPEIRTIENVAGVVLKSDGLSEAWGSDLEAVTKEEVFRSIASHAAAGDDLSYVAVVFHTTDDVPPKITEHSAAPLLSTAPPTPQLFEPMELASAVQRHAAPQKPQATQAWPTKPPNASKTQVDDEHPQSMPKRLRKRPWRAALMGFVAGLVVGIIVSEVRREFRCTLFDPKKSQASAHGAPS